MFVLSVNPLPFLLRNHEGYKIKNIKKNNITNLFFVDDLKLYAQNIEKMIKILEIVTTFSHDVGMSFGISKCAYQCIERGKQKLQNQPLEVNSLIIQEIEEGDQYKYLGMDESVGIIGPLNKQRVVKVYKTRVKKIWNSELNATNKAIAHNVFAVPIITPTIGILNWTKKEICDLDVTTRKILMMAGAIRAASDIDRLYIQRSKGGRGLRSIEDMYEIRTVGMMQHLEEAAEKHSLLKLVKEHEEKSICRLGKEFIQWRKDHQNSSNAKEGTRKEHEQRWKDKETHGYLKRTLEQDAFVDEKRTNGWLNLKLTSHVEGYIAAVQEQELNTKETQKRREKDIQKKQAMNAKCRVCGEKSESVYHLVGSCSTLAPSLYLKVRHNQMQRFLYQEITKNEHLVLNPPEVTVKGDMEIWYDMKIQMTPKVDKNRPDIVIWEKAEKKCTLVEITVLLDNNLQKAHKEKETKYINLISKLQRLYRGYIFIFEVIVVAVGGMGAVPVPLEGNLKKTIPRK